jgi:hypothetical protein
MRAVLSVVAKLCGGMALALLVLAALTAPVQDARADGGTSPCGDPLRDCIYSKLGTCQPDACQANPQACNGCGTPSFDCYSSCTGKCKGLKAKSCTSTENNDCNLSTDPAGCVDCDCTGYWDNVKLSYKCWCKKK